MEIVVFCYRGSILLPVPIRCHFSQEKQRPNCQGVMRLRLVDGSSACGRPLWLKGKSAKRDQRL